MDGKSKTKIAIEIYESLRADDDQDLRTFAQSLMTVDGGGN